MRDGVLHVGCGTPQPLGRAVAPLLLVEDNPDAAELVVTSLQKSNVGNEIVVAHDGAEALDYLYATGAYSGRDTSIMPALILLNLKLPKVGGLEVLRQVRNDPRTRLLPVVILSSSDDEPALRNSYELGANSFLRKPPDPGLFADVMQHLGWYWLHLNQSPVRFPSRSS